MMLRKSLFVFVLVMSVSFSNFAVALATLAASKGNPTGRDCHDWISLGTDLSDVILIHLLTEVGASQ